jgi:hypothetical protein
MKKLMLTLIGVLLLSANLSAGEKKKLYKWIGEDGRVHYSDEPHPGAQEIEVKEVPTIQMKTPTPLPIGLEDYESNPEDVDDTGEYYRVLTLAEPQNDGVVRNNASVITLTANIVPALYNNHTIRFFLDGKPVSENPTATSVTVEEAEYGEHSAYFVILDEEGKLLQTSPVSRFNLLHIINKKSR